MKRRKRKSRKVSQPEVKPTPKRRGRPPKNSVAQEPMKKRRGRPPKNALPVIDIPEAPRRRGRPPKRITPLPQPEQRVDKLAKYRKPVRLSQPKAKAVREEPKTQEELSLARHPIYQAALWLDTHAAPSEEQWIKKAQRQMGLGRELVIAKAILDMFNVSQDTDIRKAIKQAHKTHTDNGLRNEN